MLERDLLLTLNRRVVGSIPTQPTSELVHLEKVVNYHLARRNLEFISDTLKIVMKRLLGLTRYAVVLSLIHI